MKVAIVYVYPMVDMMRYYPLARRFADTYRQFPATRSELHILFNGSQETPKERELFSGIHCQFGRHTNFGWDIGAFQSAAETIPCDLLVCFGACVHFHRPGWESRIIESYVNGGPGLYGCACYLSPNWHVRTTAFWFPPALLQAYPNLVGSGRASRYDFEHGSHSFTRHVKGLGFPTTMVTWKGDFPFEQWQDHSPGPEDILVRDQHIHL